MSRRRALLAASGRGRSSAAGTLHNLLSCDPIKPSRIPVDVPPDLETICLKCLEKEPQRRYATAAALSDDLKRYLNHEPILARPAGWPERTAKWAKRRPTVAGLLIMIALTTIVGISGVIWQWRKAVAARDVALVANVAESQARKAEARAKEKEQRRVQQLVSLSADNSAMLHGAIENLVGSTEARKLEVERFDL